MAERLDAIVVGAGVIGLAVARALARSGREVVVLEAERTIGSHQSSRNSEVLHAGLYYPVGSLKARLCVAGRRALVRYCKDHGVAHRIVGKLVVATHDGQRDALGHIFDNARRCGVDDLERLDAAGVRALEPAVRAVAGLWSPSTGIIDSHGLLQRLLADAEEHGASLALCTRFEHARPHGDAGLLVRAGDVELECSLLVNAAGLHAAEVMARVEGTPPSAVPRLHLLRGCYFALAGPSPFSHLVYPVPDQATLGIHVTLDLAGAVRLGPDQEWIDRIDYRVDEARAASFAEAVASYYPALDPTALRPAYAGIRAKLQGPGQPPADFALLGPAEHGIAGVCHLLGIESPGLTACLAIADEALRRLGIDPPPA